jgi:hypothetical protein
MSNVNGTEYNQVFRAGIGFCTLLGTGMYIEVVQKAVKQL